MTEWFWLGIVFAGVALVVFTVVQLIAGQRERARLRARQAMSSPDIDLSEERGPVLGELTEPLGKQFPVGEEASKEIAVLLRQAGYYRPTALVEYAAVRAVLIFLPILFTLLLALLADREQMPRVLMGGAIVAALGYSIPRLYIASKAKARQREIERGLPVAVDLLSMSLLGGQNLYAAFARVSRELSRSFPALAEELEIVRLQASLNTLPHALDQWADRVQTAEVRNLVMILNQAERQGSDITKGLFEYSNNFRAHLRARAEAQANRAGVWLIFPTIFCLWLPAAIILVGPIFAEFRQRRQEGEITSQSIQNQTQQLTGANQPVTDPNPLAAP